MELSLLCGADILIVIKEDTTGLISTYSSQPNSDLLALTFNVPHSEKFTNADVVLIISLQYQQTFKPEKEDKELTTIEIQGTKRKKPTPKFIIEQAPKQTPATQTFKEKLKQKGLGLKVYLDEPATAFKPLDQDKVNSASPLLSVMNVIIIDSSKYKYTKSYSKL